MPTYEYICDSCSHEMEVFQSMSADRLTMCPDCNKESLRRKIGIGAGIIFKGSGFYETDYKNKSGSKEDSGSDSKKSDKSGGSKDSSGSSSSSSSSDSSKSTTSSSTSSSSSKSD
ncbi:MAG: FmdB family zinc ribbon protein [Opitutae bacterium]